MQPVPRSFQAHRPVLDEAWPAQPPGSPRYDPKQNFRLPLELEILTNRRCAQPYSHQVGALETQEFRTQPVPFWLVCFSDTVKGPMRQMFFVVVLPNGKVVEPSVSKRL